MKISVTIDIDNLLKKPVDEIGEDEFRKATDSLPKNVVKLPKEEVQTSPGENAKPLIHIIKKGETLKTISEKYGVSYGELSSYLLHTEGSTSIEAGQEIKIPRHFVDLTHT